MDESPLLKKALFVITCISLIQIPNWFVVNPLEQFEIFNLLGLQAPVLGFVELAVTNLGLFLVIQFALVISGLVISVNPARVARVNSWLVTFESLYGFLVNLLVTQLGYPGLKFLPAIYTLFLLLLMSNLLGLIPYSFCVTAQFALALALSSTVLIGVTFLGVASHGMGFMRLFVPAGTPLPLLPLLVVIESISYLARAISLGLRLSANMLSGHVLLKIISTFSWQFITGSLLGLILAPLPVLFLTLLYGLELGVAVIQAYVFVLLTGSYLNDAINLH
jgi:F-type H+-transporting ATPase subunit a